MPPFLFYIISAFTLLAGIGVVVNRNAVNSACSMVACFLGLACLFIGLDAFFIGIIQILVYAGAIMVLFLFIIMLLDLEAESKRAYNLLGLGGGLVVVVFFLIQLSSVLDRFEVGREQLPPLSENALKDGRFLDDVRHIGNTLFTDFNFPLQVIGVLLLVATAGVVILSRRDHPCPARTSRPEKNPIPPPPTTPNDPPTPSHQPLATSP